MDSAVLHPDPGAVHLGLVAGGQGQSVPVQVHSLCHSGYRARLALRAGVHHAGHGVLMGGVGADRAGQTDRVVHDAHHWWVRAWRAWWPRNPVDGEGEGRE